MIKRMLTILAIAMLFALFSYGIRIAYGATFSFENRSDAAMIYHFFCIECESTFPTDNGYRATGELTPGEKNTLVYEYPGTHFFIYMKDYPFNIEIPQTDTHINCVWDGEYIILE